MIGSPVQSWSTNNSPTCNCEMKSLFIVEERGIEGGFEF